MHQINGHRPCLRSSLLRVKRTSKSRTLIAINFSFGKSYTGKNTKQKPNIQRFLFMWIFMDEEYSPSAKNRKEDYAEWARAKGTHIMPKVSVLTPIYNTNHAHLRECIESILRQTFEDFEFIIINDSPENIDLDKIVQSYDDKRIKYFKNPSNMGISATRNKLIDLSQGEYLAVFDHDDISHQIRLAQQVAFLDSHPYVGVVGGWAHWFGDKDFIRKNPEFDTDIKIRLTDVCAIMHTTAMIRKSVLIDNNIRYEEQYTPAEDYRLWGRLMECTDFYNLQEVLVEYRSTCKNTSTIQRKNMAVAHESIKMQICNKFPMYRVAFERNIRRVRLRLFGKIPLVKIKNKWALLFDFIPLVKIKD